MSRRAVVGGSAVGFAAGWNIADVGAVADELALTYQVGLAFVGLFTTALFLTHMLMQLPAGRLSDRLGPGRVCLAGLAVMIVCNGLASLKPEPWLVLTARALMGVGTALGFIGGSDFVRASGGSPSAQGLYGGLATAGGGVALAVVPALEGRLGWRAPFVTAIAVGCIGAVLLRRAPWPVQETRAGGAPTPLIGIVRDRELLRLAFVFAASFGFSIVIGNWVVTLLEGDAGLSAETAGVVGALTLVLGVVSRPAGGWLLDRGLEQARAGIAIAATVGALGAILLTTGSVALALAGAVLVGLAAGIPFATAFTGAARLHPEAPATAVGLVNATGALTILLGVPLVGLAFAHDLEQWAFFAMAALWVGSIVALPRSVSRVSSA